MADYNYRNPSNAMRARRLLEKSLERAKAVLDAEPGQIRNEPTSAVAENMMPMLREEHFDGLHIYQSPSGGWYADLALKDIPPGIPKILGTPTTMPHKSRAEALESGDHIVLSMLETARQNASNETDSAHQVAVFEIDDVAVRVPAELLEMIDREFEKPSADITTVTDRLRKLHKDCGVPRFTAAALDNLDPDVTRYFQETISIALCAGIHRWPEPVAPPFNVADTGSVN